tara:strand:- start:2678 stop:2803 length:126 start_codon:yes stop_codon:yes gene_type:complete
MWKFIKLFLRQDLTEKEREECRIEEANLSYELAYIECIKTN